MALLFAIGQMTDSGQVRPANEDNLCVITPPEIAPGIDALFAVADGMGGHQAGEVASKFVADKLRELFTSARYREWVDYSPDRNDFYILALKEVIERLNDQLYQMASRRDEWRGMGTTATIALIANGQLYLAHVGDSRAYVLTNDAYRQLTKDHSWVMEQVEQGLMTLDQAASSPRKNEITRALGVSSLIRVDRHIQPVQIGDTFLLCSDGLSNLVSDAEMVRYLKSVPDPQAACQGLVQLANQRGGADNITVVIARAVPEGQAPRIVVAPPLVAVDTRSDTRPLPFKRPSRFRIPGFGKPAQPQPAPAPVAIPASQSSESPVAVDVEPLPEISPAPDQPPAESLTTDQPVAPPDDTLEMREPIAAPIIARTAPSKNTGIQIVVGLGLFAWMAIATVVNATIVWLMSETKWDTIQIAFTVGILTLFFLIVMLIATSISLIMFFRQS